jgi:hypothetical protein
MAALARAISNLTGTQVDVESIAGILVFSGIGLIISLFAVGTYGLDLSVAFF